MDIILLILLAAAFVGLLWIVKVAILWCVFLVVMLALIYLALKHPRGRMDWEHDVRTSLYFVMTVVLLLLMVYVMYLASGSFRFPPAVTVVLWISVMMMVILALAGLFFPEGYRSTKGLFERR